jgi:hypothetical protein
MARRLSVISNNPDLYAWEGDWVRWLLSDFDQEQVLDVELAAPRPDAVVVISGAIKGQAKAEAIADYLRGFDRFGYRPVLIHISDEWFDHPTSFYREASVVFRNHWRRKVNGRPACRYLPLGYASGIGGVAPKPIQARRNLWCFAGELKQQRGRMIEAARRLGPGAEHLTRSWADEASLGRGDYAAMLADTVFALCPAGNSTADTFRFYEALELGAIPVVEDMGGVRAWAELLAPAALLRLQPWRERGWRSAARKALRPSYLRTALGEGLPFPILAHWENLPAVLSNVEPVETARRVQAWWSAVKHGKRRELADAVTASLRG